MYLLYWIFKPLIYLTWKTVYKIRFIGKQNIDFSKPTLIVANHTNSVIDPVAIAVNIRKGVYFLARGDAFANNFLDWLLSQFHLLPIYRKSEFADNQEKNKEVFDRVFDILDRNHPIIIFSEGTCVQQKIIRPFKKGTAHIAVEYAIRHNDWNKLQILPIGLNYHIYNRFNDDLLQHVGEPFTLQDIGITNADDKSLIDKITQEAEQRLAKTLILQPIEALQGMEIPIETIVKKNLNQHVKFKNRKQGLYDMRKFIVNQLSDEYHKNNNKIIHLKHQLSSLEQELNYHSIPLNVFNKPFYFWNSIVLIGLIFTFPIFLFGVIVNAIPFFVPKYIADKKVKNPVFKNTVRTVVGMLLYLIVFGIYFFTVPALFDVEGFGKRFLAGIISVTIFYSSLMFSYYWFRVAKIVFGSLRFTFLNKLKKNAIMNTYSSIKQELLNMYSVS